MCLFIGRFMQKRWLNNRTAYSDLQLQTKAIKYLVKTFAKIKTP